MAWLAFSLTSSESSCINLSNLSQTVSNETLCLFSKDSSAYSIPVTKAALLLISTQGLFRYDTLVITKSENKS